MGAHVLSAGTGTWEMGSRSNAELEEAATLFDRAAALSNSATRKAQLAVNADWCRSQASPCIRVATIPISINDVACPWYLRISRGIVPAIYNRSRVAWKIVSRSISRWLTLVSQSVRHTD